MGKLQDAIDGMKAEVERTKTVNGSVRELITRYADIIEASKDDPAEVQAAVDALRAENDAMAAAVEANTEPPTETTEG